MTVDAHTIYMRENVNPLYKMDQEEALKYATKMGASDSLRGIAQGFGKTVGWETVTDYLKEKDKKLTAILNHPEYGTKANVAFLGAAVIADPLTYVPIAGWVAKGKKAKNLKDVMKYGAITSGIVGGVGYTSEDRGLIVSDDSSFAAKKAEQIGLSVGLGGLIGGVGAKTYDVISKARGKWISKTIGNCTTSVIVSFHPAFLMRQPDQKKMAWTDLKMIKKKISELKIKIEK